MQFEIRAFISKSGLATPINAVKNIILDWAVDLEKAGVLGAGLGFSVEDKKEAAMVTQNVYAQNIGNLGNLHDNSSVTNNLSANSFSVELVDQYIKRIRECVPALPPDLRNSVEAQIAQVENGNQTHDMGAVKSALKSIRTICEGAAGNIAADGIVTFIKTLL